MKHFISLMCVIFTICSIDGKVNGNLTGLQPLKNLITIGSEVIRYSSNENPLFECSISDQDDDLLTKDAEDFQLWTDGFYVQLDPLFCPDEAAVIYSALSQLDKILCIDTFVWSPGSIPTGNYVFIRKSIEFGGCESEIGRKGGMQLMNLRVPQCLHSYAILHEAMHALGLFHEHSRRDRDKHVNILWNNIRKGLEYNFRKYEAATGYGIPYDYSSLMHYPSLNALAINRTQPTILTKAGEFIEFNRELSPLDILKLKRMYGCD